MDAEQLYEILDYDPLTGEFRWRFYRCGRALAGAIAGTVGKRGYRRIGIDGHNYLAHHLAWLYAYGEWPSTGLDHRNGLYDDNRIANLREDPEGQNVQNQHRPRKDNASGFLGVHRSGRRWRAQLMIDGKNRHLGQFDTAEEAHAAYLAAKAEHHPFYDACSTAIA